jgi:hypothetical protein
LSSTGADTAEPGGTKDIGAKADLTSVPVGTEVFVGSGVATVITLRRSLFASYSHTAGELTGSLKVWKWRW